MEYRYGSHTVFNIEYHFVWVTKYRYKVLHDEVALRVKELVRQTCEAFEINIISGVVSKDHVHVFVSAPPNMAPRNCWKNFHILKSDIGDGIFGKSVFLYNIGSSYR